MAVEVENNKNKRSCWRVAFNLLLILGGFIAIIVIIFQLLAYRSLHNELKESDCRAILKSEDGISVGLAISADGELLSALDTKNLMIVETETGKIRTQTKLYTNQNHTAISPDGKFTAAVQRGGWGGSDHSEYMGDEIFILDTESGETLIIGEDEGYDIQPYFLFSPDNKDLLYTAVIDGKTGIYKLNIPSLSNEYLIEAYGPFFFSLDGKIMGTGSLEGVQLWEYQAGSPSLIQEIAIPSPVDAAAMSPDGKMIAVATDYSGDPNFSYAVTTWNIPSGELDNTLDKFSYVSLPQSLTFSPDGELLAYLGCEGRIYQASDGTVLKEIDSIGSINFETGGCVSDVVFSPQGDLYYYGSVRHLAECEVPPH